ncbi:TPA: ABC transporter ATP-binding protein [Vibrio vulnificus]|nr:ABC transporter ATP-binding protein [Vibrio vulnificus]
MKKKVKLTHNKERVLISDTLPYETPPTFSNHNFYKVISSLDITVNGGEISWIFIDETHDLLVSILYGFHSSELSSLSITNGRKYKRDIKSYSSIPFEYRIQKGSDSFRTLSVIHPKNQVNSCSFYDKHKNLVISLCNIESFSIRKPTKIARSVVYKNSNSCTVSDEEHSVELEQISEIFKSYFVYKEFNNIHKFFESTNYHRCEKIYNNMAKIDISQCFNSIYTHSIAWAIFGKSTTKNVLSGFTSGSLNYSFADDFDKLIQDSNYKETNGIPIGSEVSRIFAEIILQRVDNNIIKSLANDSIVYKKDFEIFRYVDDYFIFFNQDDVYLKILKTIQIELSEYKLSLNKSKEIIYNKPLITEITIAKKAITSLFESKLKYETEKDENDNLIGYIRVNSRSLIIDFKSIIKNSNVNYENIMNYSLAIIEKKVRSIIETHDKIKNQSENKNNVSEAISSIIDFTFFIYSASPKVNTTIKLCRILNLIIDFTKSKKVNVDEMHIIHREIFENIIFILNKNKGDKYNQVETLYLLISLSQLGKYYRITESQLHEIFGIRGTPNGYEQDYELNYFSLTVILFYIKDIKRYINTKQFIEDLISRKLSTANASVSQTTELILLAFDVISCPYISMQLRMTALNSLDISDISKQESFCSLSEQWFTKWKDFDFGEELDKKRSLEVY